MNDSPRPATIAKCCNSCEHFNDYGTWCRRWQAAPPEDVQKVGCDEYTYDEIPF